MVSRCRAAPRGVRRCSSGCANRARGDARRRRTEWSSAALGGGRATRPLAGARVGVGALTADGQAPPVPQAAVGAEIDEALHVHGDLLAELALHADARLDDLADPRDLVVAELEDTRHPIDARLLDDLEGGGATDPVDVREGNEDRL